MRKYCCPNSSIVYKKKYVDVAAMSMPPAIVNWLITAKYLFMSKKKEIFKAMQAKLEDQSTKDGSSSATNHLLRTLLSKHRNRSKGRRERHQVRLRHVLERERKKELESTPGQTLNGS